MGNLRSAWASFVLAQKLGEPWCLRFEDIDQPRVVHGAQEKQTEDMRRLGLVPDRVDVQSRHHYRHYEMFCRAYRAGRVYPCTCSRKEVREALVGMASAPHSAEPLYNGHCREHPARIGAAPGSMLTLAWRFRNLDARGRQDFICARSSYELNKEGLPSESDFVPAYNWACALDDYDGDFRILVRSVDLWDAAFQQRALQELFAELESKSFVPSAIFHTALVVHDNGHRLEKRSRGVTLDELIGRGYSVEKILERFGKSFELPETPLARGAMLKEKHERLALSDLGFIDISSTEGER